MLLEDTGVLRIQVQYNASDAVQTAQLRLSLQLRGRLLQLVQEVTAASGLGGASRCRWET